MKPDTLENHYDNLLIGAEDWSIEQVKKDIQRLRKENADLKEKLNDLGNRYEELEEKNEVLKGDLRFALDPVDKLQKELAMLRELVGVRADASACAEDAQHWLKLMNAWDNNIKLRSVLSEVDEVLTELGWHSDRGLLVRIRRALESKKNEPDNAEKISQQWARGVDEEIMEELLKKVETDKNKSQNGEYNI